MEPHEAHRGSQNAAAPGREIAGKDRCAVGCHQEAAAAGQVILHGTECSLYYRLVSKGVLPKDYNRPALDKVMLGELIDLISGIAMGEPGDKAKDILGRVYEYFLLHYVRNGTVE